MPVEDADDRAAFVDPDDFGTTATWTRNGTPSTFNAIFSRPSAMIDGGAVPTIDRAASLLCREADLPDGADEGDAIAVDGESESWLCSSIEPDGQGMARIVLKVA